jgi:hypothetical protein
VKLKSIENKIKIIATDIITKIPKIKNFKSYLKLVLILFFITEVDSPRNLAKISENISKNKSKK